MPKLPQHAHPLLLRAAVFRLLDTCVLLQEDMAGYYRTAALEKVNGIEQVFQWFQKRQVKVILLSDLDRSDTDIILGRLGWNVGLSRTNDVLIDHVLLVNSVYGNNPLFRVMQLLGDTSPSQLITVGDSPNILRWSAEAEILVNIGVTYGGTSYRTLIKEPHHGLLDSPRDIPNFLLEQLLGRSENNSNWAIYPSQPMM
ncbi:MAG: hypothetical protein AAFQ37_04310 [Bacteroidota bacterium]